MRNYKAKFKNLRKRYPKFIYQDYLYNLKGGNLEISFLFIIEPNIQFRPTLIIKNIDKSRIKKTGKEVLANLIFHLGLIEIPTYWKTTCSPEIIIKAGYLDKEQIKWWKNLIIKGMGQFFYENKIDWRKPNFIKIICPKNLTEQSGKKSTIVGILPEFELKNRYLVPFAGGRDSIVTLESLKSSFAPASAKATAGKKASEDKGKINCFSVNPTKITQNVLKIAGIKKPIIVKRIIDGKLLALNKKGYLNGHTPFTAVLSFLSVLCAVLFNYKHIVFSNEKSADEGNVRYLSRMINHQWAKSSEFEKMFKNYSKKYLAKNLPTGRQGINYFSYLRKYGELEISKMLIKYPKYFPVFSSCNASMKIGAKQTRWCGNCPKCLFVYLTLYPFLFKKELMKIFGKDIFENRKLLPIMKTLLGQGKPKPFECVGTKKESQLAFKLSLKKVKKEGKIPYLLAKIGH